MTKRLILGRFTEKQLTEAVNEALLGFNDFDEKINSLISIKKLFTNLNKKDILIVIEKVEECNIMRRKT